MNAANAVNAYIVVTLLLVALSGTSLAQGPVASRLTAPSLKMLTGKIHAVGEEDVNKGISAGITVIADDGRIRAFAVKPTTVIYSQDGRRAPLEYLRKDDPVRVKYAVSAEGVLEAAAIYQTK